MGIKFISLSTLFTFSFSLSTFICIFARYIYLQIVELITNILIEYLKHNKRIVVPKLGAFIVKQPSGIVRFSDLMRNDDGVLRSLLVAYGMGELEATGKIDRFVFEIRHAIGQNESFILEGLGEFRAGDNNTITFIHKLEPRVVGGNIKPPVEVFNIEKLKLQLSAAPQNSTEAEVKSEKRHKTKAKAEEENTLTLNKPDDYLRGLNYDDRKKKHGEDHKDKRRASKGISPFAAFIILILIAGGVFGGWRWIESQAKTPTMEYEQHIIEEVAPMVVDSLMTLQATANDSLTYKPTGEIDSLNLRNNNTVTE